MSRIGAGLTIKGADVRFATSPYAALYQPVIEHAAKLTALMAKPQTPERDAEIKLHYNAIRPQMDTEQFNHELKRWQERRAVNSGALISPELEMEMARRRVISEVAGAVGRMLDSNEANEQSTDDSVSEKTKKGV